MGSKSCSSTGKELPSYLSGTYIQQQIQVFGNFTSMKGNTVPQRIITKRIDKYSVRDRPRCQNDIKDILARDAPVNLKSLHTGPQLFSLIPLNIKEIGEK